MNQGLLEHLTLIAKSQGVFAEDLADQIASKYTSVGLLFLAIFVGLKQYIFKSIQCLVPPEWPRPHEEYAENYCWIQNTYHAAFMAAGHPELHARQETEISYFQWVPILLSIQASLVLVPHAFWRFASSQSGLDPHSIVNLAMKIEAARNERERHRLLVGVSGQLTKAIALSAQLRRQATCSGRLGRHKFFIGGWLFIGYMASKVVYLLCGLGHLYIMKVYLDFKELSFGWTCAMSLVNGSQWQQTQVFPRVTYCDVPVKDVGGQWNTHSVQCVLPANMLYEKVYIFLWFWIVLCMALTAAFSLHWIVSLALPWSRGQFIGRLVRIAQPPGIGHSRGHRESEQSQRRRQLQSELRLDDAFILRMVATRCGELCAAQILELVRVGDQQQLTEDKDEEIHDEAGTLPLRGIGHSPGLHTDVLKKGGSSNGRYSGPRVES